MYDGKLCSFLFQFAEIAEGVWCCAIKVKALINSVLSRTALACAMLTIFYPRGDLSGKRLSELDSRIVNAIASKAASGIRICKLPFQKDLYSFDTLKYNPWLCKFIWQNFAYLLCEKCWVSAVILLIIIRQPEKTATTQIWAVLLIGWRKLLVNQKHHLDLRSDVSPVWNFCTHFSDFISRGNQWWQRAMSTVFLGQSLDNENKLGRNNLTVDLNG